MNRKQLNVDQSIHFLSILSQPLTLTRILVMSLIMYSFLFNTPELKARDADHLPSLKDKRILIVYGGWKGHKPARFKDKILPWLEEQGASVLVSDSLGIYTDEKFMSEIDLIIQSWTMGEITKEQLKGLTNAVKRGTGFAGCHGGTGDSFRKEMDYYYMTGSQWVAHPGNKMKYTVHVIDAKDPIMSGIKDFEVNTEQYYMLVDPNSKVLATTQFNGENNFWIEGAVMPVVWKRYFGKGRVFYLAIGHYPEDWEERNFWKILTRGMRWAGGSKYEPIEQTITPVYPVK